MGRLSHVRNAVALSRANSGRLSSSSRRRPSSPPPFRASTRTFHEKLASLGRLLKPSRSRSSAGAQGRDVTNASRLGSLQSKTAAFLLGPPERSLHNARTEAEPPRFRQISWCRSSQHASTRVDHHRNDGVWKVCSNRIATHFFGWVFMWLSIRGRCFLT